MAPNDLRMLIMSYYNVSELLMTSRQDQIHSQAGGPIINFTSKLYRGGRSAKLGSKVTQLET